jgi:hypothetical protein
MKQIDEISMIRAGVMVFNATINTIQLYRGGAVLLIEETGVLEDNPRPVTSH